MIFKHAKFDFRVKCDTKKTDRQQKSKIENGNFSRAESPNDSVK